MRKHTLLFSVALSLLVSGAVARAEKTKFFLDAGGGKNLVSFLSDAPVEQFVGRTAQTVGTLEIDLANVETATGEATVDMTTLDTGIEGRNRHMQSEDFLDTARFPKATLTIKKVKTSGDRALAPNKPVAVDVAGDLTIKGATRPVAFKATLRYLKGDKWSAQMLGPGDIVSVSASFPIKMSDWGVKVPRMLLLKVADEVTINIKVNARTQLMQATK